MINRFTHGQFKINVRIEGNIDDAFNQSSIGCDKNIFLSKK